MPTTGSSVETAVPTRVRPNSPQFLPHTYQISIISAAVRSHKLIPGLVMAPDMTASSLALAGLVASVQAALLGSQVGQLLVALVAVALVIIVGKFVLKLAWRLITIGIVVVAAFYLLSTLGLI